jgi:hypothetical protein
MREWGSDLVVTLYSSDPAAVLAARVAGKPHVWFPQQTDSGIAPTSTNKTGLEDLGLLSDLVITGDHSAWEQVKSGGLTNPVISEPSGDLMARLKVLVETAPRSMVMMPSSLAAWHELPAVVMTGLTTSGGLVDPRTSRTWKVGASITSILRRMPFAHQRRADRV